MSDAAWGVVLLVTAAACAGLLMGQERRLPPLYLPTLTLPAEPVRERMARDRMLEARALSERAAALDALLMEQGRAEAAGAEGSDSYRRRRAKLMEDHAALVAEEGQEASQALRAHATARFEDALALELPQEQARAVVGAMATVFKREGVAWEGRILAPRFVVRTLFKARWNLLHGLSPDADFDDTEQRAFYGWQALHSRTRPMRHRIAALKRYAELGGEQADEAMGVLLFRIQDFAGSAAALERAYRKRPTIRLRNALLGARWAAGFED